jgi:hypothetical protein
MFSGGIVVRVISGGLMLENTTVAENKSKWEPMHLDYLGSVADVVKGGGGKLSLPADDPGDAPKKPKGLEP